MPVTIKTGLTLVSLIDGLWTPTQQANLKGDKGIGLWSMANAMHDSGFKLSVSPSSISILAADTGKEMSNVSNVELTVGSLRLAMQNKVGHTVKLVIKKKVFTLIDQAYITFYDSLGPTVELDIEGNSAVVDANSDLHYYYEQHKTVVMDAMQFGATNMGNKVAGIKKLRELAGCGLKEAKDVVEAWMEEAAKAENVGYVYPKKDEGNLSPTYTDVTGFVKDLADAEYLHQPVRGTSHGARYYVVAIGEHARVAVRIKSAKDISIRALCTAAIGSPAYTTVVAGFENANLQKAVAGTHWSLHLQPTDMTMAMRSIGSTLFAMTVSFTAISGNLQALVGK